MPRNVSNAVQGDFEVDGTLFRSASNGLTAFAGGGQANGTPLPSSINRITTVATVGDSVVLPAAKYGVMVHVTNAAANSANIFPAVGDAINALAANAAFALAGGKTVNIICAVDGTWNTLLSA